MLLSGAFGLPESVVRAFAIEPAAGTSFLDAEHVVILMQENRSFDHALGSLKGVRGFNDPRAVRQGDGTSVFQQKDGKGNTYGPWRLDIKDTKATWMGSLPHSRESQVDAWNGGKQDGWLTAKRPHNKDYAHVPMTMGYYTREDLPFYYALADAFTVCDQHYCGAMTSTTPNRLLMWSGTVRDGQTVASKAYMRNDEVDFGEMVWTTYPERLQKAGVSWKTYQNDISGAGGKTGEEDSWLSNFTDNALEFFANYNVHLSPKYGLKMQEEIASSNEAIAKLQAAPATAQTAKQMARHKERLAKVTREYDKSQAKLAHLPEAAQDLHRRAFVTNAAPDAQKLEHITFEENGATKVMKAPKGDVLEQFRADVAGGQMPTVSWLVAPENFSDHPSAPWYGAWYVSEVMDILTKNPEVWKKTIFILTYDENDGYFDHAPSFVAADPRKKETGGASEGIDTGLEYAHLEDETVHGIDEESARSAPIGLGFRVPMIVASPWTRGGWVNSEVFDHTSTLKFLEVFLEKKYGKKVAETNISPWRRTVCGDMTSVFRPQRNDEAELEFLDRDAFVETIRRARDKGLPTGYKSDVVARQEPGVRRACGIPYEAYVDGGVISGGKSFELQMRAGQDVFGARAAGVPFNVYRYGADKSMVAATYVVKAGGLLRETVDLRSDGKYDMAVHGPNGFYREFRGGVADPGLYVECFYERGAGGKLTGGIGLRMAGKQGYTVHVRDNSYHALPVVVELAAGAEGVKIFDLGRSHGWYDFSVTVEGFEMVKRFAGHVETGEGSYTDPLMGGVVSV